MKAFSTAEKRINRGQSFTTGPLHHINSFKEPKLHGSSNKYSHHPQSNHETTLHFPQTKPNSKLPSYSYSTSNNKSNKNKHQPAIHHYQTNVHVLHFDRQYTSGINQNILMPKQQQNKPKQNFISSHHNLRKNKMKLINEENKKMFKRINSQKSMYSNSDLNKSFEENHSISKRLSQSKMSSRSVKSQSSHSSNNGMGSISKNGKTKLNKKKNEKMVIKADDISKVKDEELINSFRNLFGGSFKKPEKQNQKEIKSIKFNDLNNTHSYRSNKEEEPKKERSKLTKGSNKIIAIEEEESEKPMGGLLHRIAEEMYYKKATNKMPLVKNYTGQLRRNKAKSIVYI